MEENKLIVKEFVADLKSDKNIKKIMDILKCKYESFGSFSGNIKVEELSKDEILALSNIIGSSFIVNNKKTVKIQDIINAFNQSKYENIDFYFVMCEFYKEKIICKKDKLENERNSEIRFLENIKNKVATCIYEFIFAKFEDKNQVVKSIYKSDGGVMLENYIVFLDLTVNYLKLNCSKNRKERLAIVAAKITKNPHYFDEGTAFNSLLTLYFCYIDGVKTPGNAEDKNLLFYKHGIMKDDISNYTMVAGLSCFYDVNSTEEHSAWKILNEVYEPFYLTTFNITQLNSMKPLKNNKVFIFENPSVFMSIYEMMKKENKKYTLICSNGQIKTSTYFILDMLNRNGARFFYSGDFDPEGLIILNKLLIRYKDNIEPFYYDIDTYKSIISDKYISEGRMKKLDNINDIRLIKVIEYMKGTKKAGYQEIIGYNLNKF